MSQDVGQTQWELANGIKMLADTDAIFAVDVPEQRAEVAAKKWTSDPRWFKTVHISAIALIKMVTHATSGGDIEIMGMMQGKIKDRAIWVMDVFALPVEGTETRVNAQQEGYEYMVNYTTAAREVGRLENVVGWYHSHPGYGCWLSGIDVATQMLNQQFQEPFLALVIDPIRTIAAGRVEIGAFRTFPENHVESGESKAYQPIPLEKIEDFGVHCQKYYQLEIEYFKSSSDVVLLQQLWNKYWLNTLSSSLILTNRDHSNRMISDLADKLRKCEITLQSSLQHLHQQHQIHSPQMGGRGSEGPASSNLGLISKQQATQLNDLSTEA